MKSLAVRQWMLIGLLTFVAAPLLCYNLVSLLDRHPPFQLQPQREVALDTALRDLSVAAPHWHDPAWQRSFATTLTSRGMAGRIRAPSGAEIVSTGHINFWQQPGRQAVILQAGQQLGTAELFFLDPGDRSARVAAIIGLILVLLNAAWQMGRNVVRPLEAMSRAAHRVAGGDLNFELPASRVREVAEARAAFEAMGAGIQTSITRQAALEAERRFFIGAIAHDLRTPLFTLRGYLLGLEQGLPASPAQAAHYVAVCRAKADQLDRLVSDLFAYTKLEYLEQTFCHAPMDLALLLRRSVDDLRDQAATKGVTLEFDDPGEPCLPVGDEHLLGRAVENLLDNALRHTPTGGSIKLRWHCDHTRVVFTVADTGAGIAPADMPYLFDPLYRGEVSRNRQTGGAGLGLAIARRAVRAHGGDLMVANRVGGGAEFTAWLPLLSPAPSAG